MEKTRRNTYKYTQNWPLRNLSFHKALKISGAKASIITPKFTMNSSIVLNNCKSQVARKIVHKSRVRLPRDLRSGDDSFNTSSFYVQSLIHNHGNYKTTDCVARLLYRQGDDWVDYEKSVVAFVRDCWSPMVEVQIGGVLCVFDFYRMLVSDFESQIEKSVAWIDVNGKCFFPKFVVGGDNDFSSFSSFREGLGKLEIEVRVSDGELSNKRKREGEDEVKSSGSCSNVNDFKKKKEGEKGEVICEEIESMRWMKAKVMGEGVLAKLVVKNLFLNWGGIRGIGALITGIHQVTRTSLVDKARYEAFLKQVETTKAARGDANVTFAWVKCASSDNVQSILNYGFSVPVQGTFGRPLTMILGEAFGVGIYMSPIKSAQACVVHHDAGENHAILCRVILGKCEKIKSGSQQFYPSSVEFDTGVDDVSNPRWYIVWGANMNTHILPECVVSYKHTRYSSGMLLQSFSKPKSTVMPKVSNAANAANAKCFVSNAGTAKFFDYLLRSLPSSKVPEVRTLCCTYKAGKVPKRIFMEKLRSVVGDQMLRTAIQEVHG